MTPNEAIVTYREIVDGISGKRQELGLEKLIFQLYEVIARDACQEMFDAKIGEFQVSSIKGRAILREKVYKKWISRIPKAQSSVRKQMSEKCYPSIPHDRLKTLLHRDLRKSGGITVFARLDHIFVRLRKSAAWTAGTLWKEELDRPSVKRFEQLLYVVSVPLHLRTARHNKCTPRKREADPPCITCNDLCRRYCCVRREQKHLHQAMKLIIEFTRKFLGLEIKPTWEKFLVSYKDSSGKPKAETSILWDLFFRGCEAFYREYGKVKKRLKKVVVTVRDSIFLRARRKFYLFIKFIRSKTVVTSDKAMSLLCGTLPLF